MPKHRPRSRQHLIAALFGAAILLGVNPAALAEEAETPAKPSFIERASAGAHEMAMNALSLLGVNYRYGGDSPDSGFDCSGMVRHVVRSALGLDLPRTAREMSRIGQHIQLDDLKPGDLVFFNTMRRAFSHVGHLSWRQPIRSCPVEGWRNPHRRLEQSLLGRTLRRRAPPPSRGAIGQSRPNDSQPLGVAQHGRMVRRARNPNDLFK